MRAGYFFVARASSLNQKKYFMFPFLTSPKAPDRLLSILFLDENRCGVGIAKLLHDENEGRYRAGESKEGTL